MAKEKSTEFRVALNPRNAEANSWFDPGTGVNLFLNTPESADLSGFSAEKLKPVKRGIRAGLLIVSKGSLPEDIKVSEVAQYASPRSRWPEERAALMTTAQANWDNLLLSQDSKSQD